MNPSRSILIRRSLIVLVITYFLTGSVWANITDGLIAYWPLDEGSGTTCTDIIGSHDGASSGAVNWVTGKVGGAFDTNDSVYFTIPQHADLRPANQVSVQAWLYIDSAPTWDAWVSNCWDTSATEAGYEFNSQGDMGFRVELESGGFHNAHAAVTLGQWVHYVGAYDGTTVRTYKDGQLVASTGTAGGPIDYSPIPYDLYIGQFHDDNETYIADSRIDEVAIWNRALTTDEIAFLYNNGQGNPATGGAYVTITESGGNTIVEEGQPADSYQVSLSSEPTAAVQITVTPSDDQVDLGSGPGVAITLDFDSGNWEADQTVDVTAYDDDVYEGKDIHKTTINHTAQGGNYEGINIRSVEVSVIDNELSCGDWGYLPTDLNRDCVVDILDYALFASEWLDTLDS
jgi:hypothetical protein